MWWLLFVLAGSRELVVNIVEHGSLQAGLLWPQKRFDFGKSRHIICIVFLLMVPMCLGFLVGHI